MIDPSQPRTSRRSFLKLGAMSVAAALALPWADWELGAPAWPSLRIHSALPLRGFVHIPFPERLLDQQRDDLDVALVPAEVAALLIQRGWLQPVRGPAGRAHDPDGRYTVPYVYRVAALQFTTDSGIPAMVSWDDPWQAGQGAIWPASGRLLAGAALLRRGYSPNDVHPGHLALAGADLVQLRPRLASPGTEHFGGPARTQGALAFVLADPSLVGSAKGLRLPTEGTMLIEYDWVILAGAARADLAQQFVGQFRAAAQPSHFNLPVRLIPLMPLPKAARAQHSAIWASLAA